MWRIYYTDGTTHDSRDGNTWSPWGVVGVLYKRWDGRHATVSGRPYYLLIDGEWAGAWENDLADYAIHKPLDGPIGFDACLMGRVQGSSAFQKIVDEMKRDQNLEVLDKPMERA